MSLYLTPRALLAGSAAREAVANRAAWPFLGSRAFALAEITTRSESGVATAFLHPHAEAAPFKHQFDALAAARPPFGGIATDQPILMGVVNVTPDSFSGGTPRINEAVAKGIALAEAGAAIVDVGGESTRPGAAVVDEAEEIERVVPVIRVLAERGLRVSLDSRHADVIAAGLAAGASIVNDITALGDARSLAVAAQSGASVVLMHMQGEPQTMQKAPAYAWAPGDIYDYLAARIAVCVAAGIDRSRIAIDPGLGFGKTEQHNAEILAHIGLFHGLGCPIVLGASRKSFIARASQGEGADERLPGSLACVLQGVAQGVQIFRVHDVAETRQALAVQGRIASAGP